MSSLWVEFSALSESTFSRRADDSFFWDILEMHALVVGNFYYLLLVGSNDQHKFVATRVFK